MATLDDRLDGLIGAKAARLLDEFFGIHTTDDLLRHYPRGYCEGMTVRGKDGPPAVGEHVTFVDVITKAYARPQRTNPKRTVLTITLGRRQPEVTATFFNANYIQKGLTKDTRVMLSGEIGYFNKSLQLTHPAFLILDRPGPTVAASKQFKGMAVGAKEADGGFDLTAFEQESFPIYPATTKVQSWDIYACVRQVLNVLDPVDEYLPESFLRQHNLVSEDSAIRGIHLAEDHAEQQEALRRLTFDEALGLQWALVGRRYSGLAESGPRAPSRPDGLASALMAQLPFALTDGQHEVLGVLSAELSSARPMNRLLQGEVGSGKTILAVLAMLQMIDSGHQCALLAPTEVLAAQHARSIREVLGPLAMGGQLGGAENATRVALLTGSMSAAHKRDVRAEVASGQAGIAVGTHALLQDTVDFKRLGMVVVDEQHRFGVEQRDRLRAKAPRGVTPHLLVMTATPIPRTVALTAYGDLQRSTLRELPRGRQPISTSVIFAAQKPAWLDRAWRRVTEEVGAGRQGYVVAPRIDDGDGDPREPDPNADANGDRPKANRPDPTTKVVELFGELARGPLAGVRLGLMHGRLPADEKDAVMTAFRTGEIDVLVCTTVIEVGVDVPNATVMVVMDADRFGISQLHQLRGRIGRGTQPSVCLLHTRSAAGSRAGARLTAVAGTLDGFELADLDLAERLEGDVLGRNQSGRAIGLKLLSLAEHRDVIEAADDYCEGLHAAGQPVHPGLARLAARFTASDRIDYMDKS